MIDSKKMAILCLFIGALGACASQNSGPGLVPQPGISETSQHSDKGDAERLAELRNFREEDTFAPNFALGPGDVLTISEPDLKELNQREVRVSANNTITLPLVGAINTSGMTEDQLRQALQARLAVIVKDPQVDVLVKEYHTRQIAVLGMVRQPGLYTLASRSDTVQDMLGRAGGMTEGASSRLLFVPANRSATSNEFAKLATASVPRDNQTGIQRVGSGENRGDASTDSREAPEAAERASAARADSHTASSETPESILEADPIVIDLTGENGTSELDLPARPGDLLIVPAAGEVMVDGWVKNPGAYKISNGMTALGAVTAAGGAMFSSAAVVLRTNPDKTKTTFQLDLSKVRSGSQPDIPIQASDVVVVQKSVIGAVQYGLYAVFQRFGTGMIIPY